MIENLERGNVVEVSVFKKIAPSQIFTSFTDEYMGRISIFDLDWSIPLALKKFSEIQEGNRIQCVVLHIDHQNKIVELAIKYIIENVSNNIGWDRILIGNEYHATVLEELNHYKLLKISDSFYGFMPKASGNGASNIRIKVTEKDSFSNLLYVVSAEEDVEFNILPELEEKLSFIEDECQSYSAFKRSLMGEMADNEQLKEIQKGFRIDKKIFSKTFKTGKKIYLQFAPNSDAFDYDFLRQAVPFYTDGNKQEVENQKKVLEHLSSQKYWFKVNEYYNKSELITEFTFFNDVVIIHGNIVDIENDNKGFFITKLNVQNKDSASSWRKKRFAGKNSFLFSDEIQVLSKFDSVPIGYSQKEIAEIAIQKERCFEIKGRLALQNGVLLQKEARTLAINDKFLEFQIERLRNGKRKTIEITNFERVPSDEEGLALKLSLDIAEEIEVEDSISVLVKLEDATSFRAILSVEKEFCLLKFKNNINFNVLKKGFELQPSISTSQFDVQRTIINDFMTGEINIKHFEKVLLKKNNIATPTLKHVDFINKQLKSTQISDVGNSQITAVRKAVGNQNIFLIQGPPGTGKTTVITEIIEQLVKSGEKILVSGQNHVAVDNVLFKLSDNPALNLLRIGQTEKIDEKVVKYNVDKMVEAYQQEYKLFLRNQLKLVNNLLSLFSGSDSKIPEREDFNNFVKFISKDYQRLQDIFRQKHFNLYDGLKDLGKEDLEEIKIQLDAWLEHEGEILDLLVKPIVYTDANVVFATCIGIKGDDFFKDTQFKFDTVIIDEAGKANITETLVPMELGKKVILVGDHKQLQPYIDSSLLDTDDYSSFPKSKLGSEFTLEEIKHATETSFFEFLTNRIKANEFPKENVVGLNVQHRMHPTIGEFVSKAFYGGTLKMGDKTEQNHIALKPPFDKEIVFFDTSNYPDPFERRKENSIWNDVEADYLLNYVLAELKGQDIQPENIAIIAPYKAQVAMINKKIQNSREPFFLGIEVATLDSFQGKEYDVIIFSFTRSADNTKPQYIDGKKKFIKVGFLDDARRLNVAFSRARKKLILIGNAETLTNENSHFDFLFDYTELFRNIVKIAKDESKGRFINCADNMSVESPFEKFTKKYKKGDLIRAKFKRRLPLDNGYSLFFFIVDGLDCPMHEKFVGIQLKNKMDALTEGEEVTLKISEINIEKNKVLLCGEDFVFLAEKRNKFQNNIEGLKVGYQLQGIVVFKSQKSYKIKIKEDLYGFLHIIEARKLGGLTVGDTVLVKVKWIDKENKTVFFKF